MSNVFSMNSKRFFLFLLFFVAGVAAGSSAPFFVSAAGVIDNAPTLATALLRTLTFLLEIFGILAILALVISGILYFTAGGNTARLELAKKSFLFVVIGIVIGLGALVLVRAVAKFFEV